MRISMLALVSAIVLAYPAIAMTLASSDIKDGQAIPTQHIYPRCGGQNVSPQLSWDGQPAGTKSLVLTMIDIDVKPALWSHWIVTGLPAGSKALAQGAPALPEGAHGIASNFGDTVYAGPCPPTGSGTHRYQFTIWAMPTADVVIAADAPAKDVIAKLSADALAHASMTASVQR
jgi:Raf kinase inhibitor-like YbhB/YbcL family protein